MPQKKPRTIIELPTMREPVSIRISDESNPERGEQFQRVLSKRKASPSDVIRGLVDAYIRCEGEVSFPVRLSDLRTGDAISRVAKLLGMSECVLVDHFNTALELQVKEYGGAIVPFELMPYGTPTPAGRAKAKRMIHELTRRGHGRASAA
jgi:hypothetical protein